MLLNQRWRKGEIFEVCVDMPWLRERMLEWAKCIDTLWFVGLSFWLLIGFTFSIFLEAGESNLLTYFPFLFIMTMTMIQRPKKLMRDFLLGGLGVNLNIML